MIRSSRGTARRAWSVAAVMATAATLGAACGGQSGETAGDGGGEADVGMVDFEATGAFLASASERSAAEPYRFETSMSMTVVGGGESVEVDAPFSSGAVNGDGVVQHIDMHEYMSQAGVWGGAAGLPDAYLTIDTVVDGRTMWLRAPILALVGELRRVGMVPPALTELGDGWGRVDISSLGPEAVGKAARLAGSPTGGDPREILAMLESAGDVTELGEDTVDGDPVEGIGASVAIGELIEAGGTDLDNVTAQAEAAAGDGMSPEENEAAVQAVLEADMPIEAWVDDQGYVRRIVMTLDLGAVVAEIGGQADGPEEFVIGTTIEFTDYGDSGIDVAPPPEAADAVDVTEAFTQAMG